MGCFRTVLVPASVGVFWGLGVKGEIQAQLGGSETQTQDGLHQMEMHSLHINTKQVAQAAAAESDTGLHLSRSF